MIIPQSEGRVDHVHLVTSMPLDREMMFHRAMWGHILDDARVGMDYVRTSFELGMTRKLSDADHRTLWEIWRAMLDQIFGRLG
jgi:hypothetical protein